MNLFELVARITLDDKEYKKGLADTQQQTSGFVGKFKSGMGTMGKGLALIKGPAGIAINAFRLVGSAVNAVIEGTAEYRESVGKLNTAFEAAGMSQKEASQAYQEFYGLLGETDTATEAAQLLSHLARNEEDVAEWSRIAAGVVGQFGQSIPLEALVEAGVESSRTGELVGSLTDAFVWAGINEDEFNAKLQALGTEEERNQLITETLTDIYGEAGDAYNENNQAIINQREQHAKLDAAMGKLGDALLTIKNGIFGFFLPAVVAVIDGLAGFANGTINVVKGLKELYDTAKAKVAEFKEIGKELVIGFWNGIKEKSEWVKNKVSGFVDGIKSRFTGKSGFDIHSPSKWAAEVGFRIPEGMAVGFVEGAPLAIGAAEMLVDSVQGSIEQKIQAAAGKTITERLLEAAGAPLSEEEIQKKMFFARGRKSNVEEQRLDRERERRRERGAQRQVQLDQIARERESRMRDRKNLNAFTGEKFKTTVVRSQNQPPANVVRMPEYRPEPQVIQVTLELDGEVLARKMVKYNENETIRRGVPLLGGA